MSTQSAVLNRFLHPVCECLTPGLAQQLVEFRIDRITQAYVDDLARIKCNQGVFSASERPEYEAIIEEADMIALLQAKARTFLSSVESKWTPLCEPWFGSGLATPANVAVREALIATNLFSTS